MQEAPQQIEEVGSIAAVVNLHDEGANAVPSLISAWRAVEHARRHDIDVELVLCLDVPDDDTMRVAADWERRGARVVFSTERDLGGARNTAVKQSDATWFAFLDGDDLWGETWLLDAYVAAISVEDPSPHDVWHPRISVIFGGARSLIHHRQSHGSSSFSWARLRLHNGWTALSFVRRATLQEIPYPRNRLRQGFGFEDWSWNIEVLRRGGRHRIVRDTVHAIRRRPPHDSGSLLGRSTHALRVPYPDPIVEPVQQLGPDGHFDLTVVEDDLPPTHHQLHVELNEHIYGLLKGLGSIEPGVASTIKGPGRPRTLAQNTNAYVTIEQVALAELDQRAAEVSTMSELFAVDEFQQLPEDSQDLVVAAVRLDRDFPLIDNPGCAEIDRAVRRFPQLEEL